MLFLQFCCGSDILILIIIIHDGYRYSAFSSWTPSLASQKVLLRLEIRSGSCNFVIPTENGKTMTTNVAFEGLVVKTKKLRVVQSLELRFNKFSVSAGIEGEEGRE